MHPNYNLVEGIDNDYFGFYGLHVYEPIYVLQEDECFCGIRHVTVPIATRILIANVRHIGLSNICVINLVYFKMQV